MWFFGLPTLVKRVFGDAAEKTFEDDVQKAEHEVVVFFQGAGHALITKFGAKVAHEAISIAVPLIKTLMTANIPNADKHAQVVAAIKTGLGEAANAFTENDFSDVISSGI